MLEGATFDGKYSFPSHSNSIRLGPTALHEQVRLPDLQIKPQLYLKMIAGKCDATTRLGF